MQMDPPALRGTRAFYTVNGGRSDFTLRARDITNGDVKWSVLPTGGVLTSPPLVVNGRVYVVSPGNGPGAPQLLAFDGETGAPAWSDEPPVDEHVYAEDNSIAAAEGVLVAPMAYRIFAYAAKGSAR